MYNYVYNKNLQDTDIYIHAKITSCKVNDCITFDTHTFSWLTTKATKALTLL